MKGKRGAGGKTQLLKILEVQFDIVLTSYLHSRSQDLEKAIPQQVPGLKCSPSGLLQPLSFLLKDPNKRSSPIVLTMA